MQNAECKMQNEKDADSLPADEGSDDASVGAVIGRPPEAEASDDEAEMQNAECKMQNEKNEAMIYEP